MRRNRQYCFSLALALGLAHGSARLALAQGALPASSEPEPAPEAPPALALDEPGPGQPPAAVPSATAAAAPGTSGAQDSDDVVVLTAERNRPRELGLNPGTPRAPGGLGAGSSNESQGAALEPGWAFQFHGYLAVPLSVGIGSVDSPAPGQSKTTLHTPPAVADTWGSFAYANIVPGPWVQLNFSYGNQSITGTVVVAAYSLSSASSWYNPAAQLGINKAFLTWDMPGTSRLRLLMRVGALGSSYGYQGEYDNGRYETPVIAQTNGLGETFTAEYRPSSSLALQLEQGFSGSQDIAPEAIRMNSYTGASPAGSRGISEGSSLCAQNPPRTTEQARTADQNASLIGPAYGWPDCNAGTSFVHHLHAGVGLGKSVHASVHWLHAFSMDERTPDLPPAQQDPEPSLPARDQPSGQIDVLGGELRLKSPALGHFYAGGSYTKLVDASTVGTVLSVLNAGAGAGISRQYLGPQSRGNGSVLALGAQWEVSVGRLLTPPEAFSSEAPDVTLALFGMAARAKSPDADFDGKLGYKAGAELTWSALPSFALQGRFDHVTPDSDDSGDNREIVSARAIVKSEWLARERIWLQYSRWFLGDGVVDPYTGVKPSDRDMVSLVGTLWW